MSYPSFLMIGLLLLSTLGTTSADVEAIVPFPFPSIVTEAFQCEMCGFTLMNGLISVDERLQNFTKRQLVLDEDQVLSVFEDICDPFLEKGQWIRRGVLKLNEKTRTAEFDVLHNFTECKRFCGTLSAMCETVYDSDAATNLAGNILKLIKRGIAIVNTKEASRVIEGVCGETFCTHSEKNKKALFNALQSNEELWEELLAERAEEVDDDRIEVESLMAKMKREGRRSSIYSRNEIKSLRKALQEGNRSAAAAIDPKLWSIPDEEFDMLVDTAREQGDPDDL